MIHYSSIGQEHYARSPAAVGRGRTRVSKQLRIKKQKLLTDIYTIILSVNSFREKGD